MTNPNESRQPFKKIENCDGLWPTQVTYDSNYYGCQLVKDHYGRHIHNSEEVTITWRT